MSTEQSILDLSGSENNPIKKPSFFDTILSKFRGTDYLVSNNRSPQTLEPQTTADTTKEVQDPTPPAKYDAQFAASDLYTIPSVIGHERIKGSEGPGIFEFNEADLDQVEANIAKLGLDAKIFKAGEKVDMPLESNSHYVAQGKIEIRFWFHPRNSQILQQTGLKVSDLNKPLE